MTHPQAYNLLHSVSLHEPAWSIHYCEFAPPPDLLPSIVCCWKAETHAGPGIPDTFVVPDGCVDLILWADRVSLVGFMTSGFGGQPRTGTTWGIRMRPPALAAILHDRPSTLVGISTTPGGETIDLRDQTFNQSSDAASLEVLWRWCRKHLANATGDSLAWHAAARLAANPSRAVASVASELRISERHLCRLFREEVGPSPKAFGRQMRFIAALEFMEDRRNSLADVAFALGLPDQARLNHECMKLSGLTPGKLRTMQCEPGQGLILTRPRRRLVHPGILINQDRGDFRS